MRPAPRSPPGVVVRAAAGRGRGGGPSGSLCGRGEGRLPPAPRLGPAPWGPAERIGRGAGPRAAGGGARLESRQMGHLSGARGAERESARRLDNRVNGGGGWGPPREDGSGPLGWRMRVQAGATPGSLHGFSPFSHDPSPHFAWDVRHVSFLNPPHLQLWDPSGTPGGRAGWVSRYRGTW